MKTCTQDQVDMMINSATDNSIRQRMAAAMAGGYDYADTLHNIYLDYGYPADLTFFNFWNMYRRFGIARRVVELYPAQTWLDDPTVEGSGSFNRGLEMLVKKGLWRRLQGLDTRQRIGRYAGLFMLVRDNKKPNEPIDGKLNGLGSLVDLVPLYESQLEVSSIQDDASKDGFGSPTMYHYSGGVVGNRNEKSGSSFQIHPDRIIIASEDSDNGSIYGIPVLESIYNDLMDLRKILGGGGEGFYKNAAQSIVFDVKDAASAKTNASLLDKFNENYDEFSQNRARRAMWTPGMEARPLNSTLMSPMDFAMVSLMSITAGANIPVSLLIGNQTGRLAGDQDSKMFLQQVQARRLDFGTDLVRKVLDWLQDKGVLESGEYEIEWPDALAPSSDEKLGNAIKMADVNNKQFLAGDSTVPFSSDEIREAAGYEFVEDDEIPDETLDDEIPDETLDDDDG